MIVDASVILSAFFPDEAQDQAQALIREHVIGQIQLSAPALLLYEVTNAVLQAKRRERISDEQAHDILSSFEGLGIALEPVGWQQMLPLAVRFDRSAYDAAYLALAEATEQPLITGDARMYNAVREHLEWVQWIGEYPSAE
ncbi:MAG: type II toxin-antitoxin system VapC family toxin [Anaerolineae bacterium]